MALDNEADGFSDGVAFREKVRRAHPLPEDQEELDALSSDARLAKMRSYHREQMDDMLATRSDMFKRTPPDVSLTAAVFAKEEADLRASILREKGASPAVADIRLFTAEIDGKKVLYTAPHQERPSFVDDGKRIDLLHRDDEIALLAALQLAEQRWGQIKVTGSPDFRDQVVRLAAEHDMQLANPDLAMRVAELRAAGGYFSAPDGDLVPQAEKAPLRPVQAQAEEIKAEAAEQPSKPVPQETAEAGPDDDDEQVDFPDPDDELVPELGDDDDDFIVTAPAGAGAEKPEAGKDWDAELEELQRAQREAKAEGRRAEREGRRVIYIHGEPYADPGDDEAHGPAAAAPAESEAPKEEDWVARLRAEHEARREAAGLADDEEEAIAFPDPDEEQEQLRDFGNDDDDFAVGPTSGSIVSEQATELKRSQGAANHARP